jgi:hypothetical protein
MERISAWLDGAAVGASALCLAHCLGLPLVAAATPALAGWLGADEGVHAALLALAAPLALLALWRGWRAHGLVAPAALGAAGLALMTLALATHELERALTVAGVSVLAVAHLMNWRLHRRAHAP